METSTGGAYINKVHEEQGIFIRWTVLLEQNLEAFSLDGLYIHNNNNNIAFFSQANWGRLEMKPERNKFRVQAQ